MHDAGAGIERDVLAEIDRREPVIEGVMEGLQFEVAAGAGGDD